MLSTNTLLKGGRYRIGQLLSPGHKAALYAAHDSLRNETVAVLETAMDGSDGNHVFSNLQHDGLVRVCDSFQAGACDYSVTEPLQSAESPVNSNSIPTEKAILSLIGRLGAVLMALSELLTGDRDQGPVTIRPENILITADGKLKLFYIDPAKVNSLVNPADSPYLPLESVWESLDHISQKGIYNHYDEASMKVLESPADVRTGLYSLGAIFFKLLTGQSPPTAFERSIELLDSKIDPLAPPSSVNPAVSKEYSDFVSRLVEVRREYRFGSVDDAIFSLPAAVVVEQVEPIETVPVLTAVTDEPDELDLLEIPVTSAASIAPVIPVSSNGTKVKSFSDVGAVVDRPVAPIDAPHFAAASDKPFPKVNGIAPIVEEPKKRVATAVAIKSAPDVQLFHRTDQPAEKKTGFKMIGLAAAGLMIVAAGGWALMNLPSGKAPSPSDPAASVMTQPPAKPDVPDAAPDQVAVSTASNTAPSSVPGAETGMSQPRQRPQIAEAKPVKPTDPKSVKAEPKPTKKVTVDDLINDN